MELFFKSVVYFCAIHIVSSNSIGKSYIVDATDAIKVINENENNAAYAAVNGNITTVETIVKSLHSSGMMAQFTSQNFYSFAIIVALAGSSEMLQLLFDNGLKPNEQPERSRSVLQFSICYDSVPNKSGLVKTLFGNGATLENDNGMELLKCAFLYGEMDVMKMLISNGVDVNVREPTTNNTVLHQVCRNSDAFTYFKSVHIKEEAILIQPLEWLISKGFDINVRNNLGYTAIHQIAYRRYINVAKILLDAGADVNIASKYGYTPLLMAFASLDPYEDMDMIQLLIQNGARLKYNKTFRALRFSIQLMQNDGVDQPLIFF